MTMAMGMEDVLPLVSTAGFLATTLVFWVRGVKKASRSDLLAGVLLLIVSCVVLMAMARSCEVLNTIGVVFIGFGVASLFLSRKTETRSAVIRKASLRAVGMFCIFLGVLLQLHA